MSVVSVKLLCQYGRSGAALIRNHFAHISIFVESKRAYRKSNPSLRLMPEVI